LAPKKFSFASSLSFGGDNKAKTDLGSSGTFTFNPFFGSKKDEETNKNETDKSSSNKTPSTFFFPQNTTSTSAKDENNTTSTTSTNNKKALFKPSPIAKQVSVDLDEEVITEVSPMKLHFFEDNNWTERGKGSLKVCWIEKNKKARVIARRGGVLTILINSLVKNVQIQKLSESKKHLRLFVTVQKPKENNKEEMEIIVETFLLRSTPENTANFYKQFIKLKHDLDPNFEPLATPPPKTKAIDITSSTASKATSEEKSNLEKATATTEKKEIKSGAKN